MTGRGRLVIVFIPMPSSVATSAISGLSAVPVKVEVDVASGLAKFLVVGLPDPAVQEARERVRAAVKNSGFHFPLTRVTISLAPAELRKGGSQYDLPMALGILLELGVLPPIRESHLIIGELALDGSTRPVSGVLASAMLAKRQRVRSFFCPEENVREAVLVRGARVYPVRSLLALVDHLTGKKRISPARTGRERRNASPGEQVTDFSSVVGQYHAKRALTIAAAGGHNVLLVGPPGSGKTLLARALPGILPPLTDDEALEVTNIYSIAGKLPDDHPLVTTRPFRSPHHSASGVALVGGGSVPRPGEITLAHRGVLFLDELAEFARTTLDQLRQPLEEEVITISRAAGSITFAASLLFIAATNPCPCGFATDRTRPCTCSALSVSRYWKRLSGPLLDRIDLHIDVPPVRVDDILQGARGEPSDAIRRQVVRARERQQDRYGTQPYRTNSQLPAKDMRLHLSPTSGGGQLLQSAVQKQHLTMRGYHHVIRVARTIADLAGAQHITVDHAAEALQYRQQIGPETSAG